MARVDRWLLGRVAGEPRVALVPTASGNQGLRRVHYWLDLGVEHFSRLGAQVEPLDAPDRRAMLDERVAEHIAGCNFVYLSGGRPDYLHACLEGTPVWAAIRGVLDAGGVVAGCSAGAMIWGEKFPGYPRRVWPWHTGFCEIPGAFVLPHYDEVPGWLARLVRASRLNRMTLLGIERDTALVRRQGRFEVRGGGRVEVRGRSGALSYREGQTVTWD